MIRAATLAVVLGVSALGGSMMAGDTGQAEAGNIYASPRVAFCAFFNYIRSHWSESTWDAYEAFLEEHNAQDPCPIAP